jgi:hypothetical protein
MRSNESFIRNRTDRENPLNQYSELKQALKPYLGQSGARITIVSHLMLKDGLGANFFPASRKAMVSQWFQTKKLYNFILFATLTTSLNTSFKDDRILHRFQEITGQCHPIDSPFRPVSCR